jgi:hypothetical protein
MGLAGAARPAGGLGVGATAHLLVGALSHSSRFRAVLAESEEQPYLIEGLDAVSHKLGGLPHKWRFDRMSTVCDPGSGRLRASFAAVATHYAVGVKVCPSKRAWRKGVVEKANHSAAQRWWRTLGDDVSPTAAQASLDRLCVRLDGRRRTREGTRTTVGALADAEPLRAMPVVYPATLSASPTVSAQALVAFRGNFYSVPPGHAGQIMQVHHRLGATTLDVLSPAGVTLARHARQPDGAGVVQRLDTHVAELSRAVLSAFSDRDPCRSKERRPPGEAARAEAERIRGEHTGIAGEQVVVGFAAYAAAVRPLGVEGPTPKRSRYDREPDGAGRRDPPSGGRTGLLLSLVRVKSRAGQRSPRDTHCPAWCRQQCVRDDARSGSRRGQVPQRIAGAAAQQVGPGHWLTCAEEGATACVVPAAGSARARQRDDGRSWRSTRGHRSSWPAGR